VLSLGAFVHQRASVSRQLIDVNALGLDTVDSIELDRGSGAAPTSGLSQRQHRDAVARFAKEELSFQAGWTASAISIQVICQKRSLGGWRWMPHRPLPAPYFCCVVYYL
jgi:hypothetical protein